MTIRFYVTVGRGLEKFVENLLRDEIKATDIETLNGKTAFCVESLSQIDLQNFPFVERIFASLHCASLKTPKDRKEALDIVMTALSSREKLEKSVNVLESILPKKSDKIDVEEPETKRAKKPTAFRLSVKCTGQMRYNIDAEKLTRQLGNRIVHTCGWVSQLKKYDVDLNVYMGNDYVAIGLPLTKQPLSKHSFIRHLTLRTTVCQAMASLLGMSVTSVIDPMCGGGTLLVEVAQVTVTGVDLLETAVTRCKENIAHYQNCQPTTRATLQVVLGDSRTTLMSSESADGLVCDLPFGQKYHKYDNIPRLYERVLKQFARILRAKSRAIFMTNLERRENLKELSVKNGFVFIEDHEISLGDTAAVICVFQKE